MGHISSACPSPRRTSGGRGGPRRNLYPPANGQGESSFVGQPRQPSNQEN
jgi:hypothetical protein